MAGDERPVPLDARGRVGRPQGPRRLDFAGERIALGPGRLRRQDRAARLEARVVAGRDHEHGQGADPLAIDDHRVEPAAEVGEPPRPSLRRVRRDVDQAPRSVRPAAARRSAPRASHLADQPRQGREPGDAGDGRLDRRTFVPVIGHVPRPVVARRELVVPGVEDDDVGPRPRLDQPLVHLFEGPPRPGLDLQMEHTPGDRPAEPPGDDLADRHPVAIRDPLGARLAHDDDPDVARGPDLASEARPGQSRRPMEARR